MSDLLKSIDARTKLAGTNKLEILLFSLGLNSKTGRRESFGINVFKVREVMRTPPITSARICQHRLRVWSVCVVSWCLSLIWPSTRGLILTRRAQL